MAFRKRQTKLAKPQNEVLETSLQAKISLKDPAVIRQVEKNPNNSESELAFDVKIVFNNSNQVFY